MAQHWKALAAAATILFSAAGCPAGDDSTPDGTADSDVQDVADEGDAIDQVEYEPECAQDADCDDEVDCTTDTCQEGLCRNSPNDEICQDGAVCNGQEQCDSRDGCVNGEPYWGCFDSDPCTADRCVEPEPGSAPTCDHAPLDRDGDLHVDMRCGGDDCNDVDPLSFPGAMERCADTNDNNCDGLTDALDPVCQMNFDSCSSPRELTSGVEWEGFTTGATGDVAMSCDSSTWTDVVFYFDLAATSDILLSVDARDEYAYVALQTECGVSTSDLRCVSNNQVSIFKRALEAGRYYVVVSGWEEMTFLIRLDVFPSGPVPPGDTCDDPIPLTLPASVTGDLTRMDDDYRLPCVFWSGWSDTVYSFELTAPKDVTIDVASMRAYRYVGVQSACDEPATALACDSGYPFHRTLGNVPAGTYYLWVESEVGGEYSLRVTADDPTPPPVNDVCAGAIDVSDTGLFEGSFLAAGDDYVSSCEWGTSHRDLVYRLTLAEAQAVSIVLTGYFGLTPDLAVRTVCGTASTETTCRTYGYPTTMSWASLAAGTYYLIVESDEEGTFGLDVDISPPIDPCAGLTAISGSGTFSGTTTGGFDSFQSTTCGGTARGPDRAYLLVLASDSVVTAETTAGTFDTVLYVRSACADPASEIACDDDSGSAGGGLSRLTRALGAGTYYLIVDGYGSSSSGSYTLSVTVAPP